jgi:DNA polymerase-3 subunit delta
MPAAPAKVSAPLVLIHGDDDFAVRQRAKEIHERWRAELGGDDHEVIDGRVTNSEGSLKVLGKLREALQTLPFFGGGKAIWLSDCNFLGDDKKTTTKDVTEMLAEVAQELKEFQWTNVRLVISAGDMDKRRTFYKTLEKSGKVEVFAGLSASDREWADKAEGVAIAEFRARKKNISDEALGELVSRVGPNARLLTGEVEKLCVFAGAREDISLGDVNAVCVRNKTARAFALGDALGDRDLARLLRCLDDELWEMKFDKEKSEIGLLYGIIGKVRALLFLKEMLAEGWIKATSGYDNFKSQLEHVAETHSQQLPADRKFNPLAQNPYVLFKALPQAGKYSRAELVRALEVLLQANHQFFTSGLDETLILQQALVKIVGRGAPARV